MAFAETKQMNLIQICSPAESYGNAKSDNAT